MASPRQPVEPDAKKLRVFSFAVHATRGLLRDQNTRRKAMFGLTLIALVMLVCGGTVLAPALDAHERPGWFVFYWVVCAWITFTIVLLALFDLLVLRREGHLRRKELTRKLSESKDE